MLKTALNPFARFTARPIGLITTPLYLNSSSSAANTLRTVLDEQIRAQESQKKQLDNFHHYFNNLNFNVRFHDAQVVLSKKFDNYNVRIVTYAKAPPAQVEEEQKQNQEQDFGDYQQINLFLNKEGKQDSMCIVMVQQQGQSQIASMYFVDSQQKQELSLASSSLSTSPYHGPDIHSLDEELQKRLAEFLSQFGITPQLLDRTTQLSNDYEQKLYLEWLKDMRSVV